MSTLVEEVLTLRLQQASMQWKDSGDEKSEDYDAILKRQVDAVGFTEVYGSIGRLREAARGWGYNLVFGPTKGGKAETVIAVRKDHEIADTGSILVNPAERGKAPSHGHSTRYLTWVTFDFYGEEVTFAEGHWVTSAGGRRSRVEKRTQMSEEMAELAALKGKGAALFFGAGDTNDDDEVDNSGSEVYEPLAAGSLETIFDELRQWPPTHKGKADGTIDVIFGYTRDLRVTAKAVLVHRRGNSDHFQVEAVYEIRRKIVIAPPEPTEHDCPLCHVSHLGVVLPAIPV